MIDDKKVRFMVIPSRGYAKIWSIGDLLGVRQSPIGLRKEMNTSAPKSDFECMDGKVWQ